MITTATYGMDDGFTEFITGIGIETCGEKGLKFEFVGGSDGTGQ